MGKYQRLTLPERYQIEVLKKSNHSLRSISRLINRSASSISREIKRNGFLNGSYKPQLAQARYLRRRESIHPPFKIKNELKCKVISALNMQWSPEQISGRFAQEGLKISHEAIYQFVFREYKITGQLWVQLRKRRRFRRSREAAKNLKNAGLRYHRVWIEERPSIVEKRERIGDFERDTLLGKARHSGPALLTMVDRVSKISKINKIEKLRGDYIHRATIKALTGVLCHSITNDNGSEFSKYKMTEELLKVGIYFNHPGCPWERGTNENTNGLIRQYFPKGTDFTKVSTSRVRQVQNLLNNRPRKCLDYRTPNEVHKKLCRVLH